MSIIEAFFLGLIQGITEFLPVSSSGHLIFFQNILGLSNLKNFILFDIVCHLGTLLAVVLVFSKDIKELLTKKSHVLVLLIIAILPLFPLVALLKPIKKMFESPEYLGYFFLITSCLLYLGIRFGRSTNQPQTKKQAFIIGLFQAGAIIPGISRSGSTITAARLLGWEMNKAVTFSFLLSIPTILGATILELGQVLLAKETLPNISYSHYLLGFISSFIFGFVSLLVLQKLASKQKFMYFVWYCLVMGLITIFYFR